MPAITYIKIICPKFVKSFGQTLIISGVFWECPSWLFQVFKLGGIKDDKYGVDEVAYECEAAERADTNEDRAGYDGKQFADEVDSEAGFFELPHLDGAIDAQAHAEEGQDDDGNSVLQGSPGHLYHFRAHELFGEIGHAVQFALGFDHFVIAVLCSYA